MNANQVSHFELSSFACHIVIVIAISMSFLLLLFSIRQFSRRNPLIRGLSRLGNLMIYSTRPSSSNEMSILNSLSYTLEFRTTYPCPFRSFQSNRVSRISLVHKINDITRKPTATAIILHHELAPRRPNPPGRPRTLVLHRIHDPNLPDSPR